MAAEVGELLEARGGSDQLVDLRLPLSIERAAGAGVERGYARERGRRLLERLGALRGEPVGRRAPELVDRLADSVYREVPVQVGYPLRAHPDASFVDAIPIDQSVADSPHVDHEPSSRFGRAELLSEATSVTVQRSRPPERRDAPRCCAAAPRG